MFIRGPQYLAYAVAVSLPVPDEANKRNKSKKPEDSEATPLKADEAKVPYEVRSGSQYFLQLE